MINLATLSQRFKLRDPSAPALIDPQRGASTSFGRFGDRIDWLATGLRGLHGLEAGAVIAAISKNTIQLLELYLASARGGYMLFPLNWRFSAEQVLQALRDARPSVVFYDAELRGVVDAVRSKLDVAWVEWSTTDDCEYEELLERSRRKQERYAALLPDPNSLAHLPYLAVSTGGTTGIFKSAVHTQASYAACVLDYQSAARISETDVYLMLGQYFHVVAYLTLAYLAREQPVVLTTFEADSTLEIIHEEKVTAFMTIASMLPRLLQSLEKDGRPTKNVRVVEYGGAPIAPDVIREAAEKFDADMLQTWGMTEFGPGTYMGAEAHRRALSGERPELLRSCGKAALLSTLAVLDENGLMVPRDGRTIGELCHRGPNNMIGYWNNPTETAHVIRDGWLHTGDLATWDDEGFYFIVDRLKSMIISGGENIFPSEVERCLGDHPAIAEVVCVGMPDESWGEILKAVVVRRPGHELTEADVAAFVGQRLASYKKPRIVQFVDEIPMTPTGKVNRKLLQSS
jgi:long-chain acyl-CoA synthetase